MNSGHIKDINNPLISNTLQIIRTNNLCIKKTEKLIFAVYLLTDFYDDREPLKWELRAKALHIDSLLREFFVGRKTSGELPAREIAETIFFIIEKLKLSFNLKFISEMNFIIIKGEYEVLWKLFKDIADSKDFPLVSLPENLFIDIKDTENTEDNYKGQDKRHDLLRRSHKDYMENISKNEDIFTKENRHSAFINNSFSRKDTILKFIKVKGSSSVKDIGEVVRGCSEKTIQRDLIALIGEGLIRREGKRRWSRYVAV